MKEETLLNFAVRLVIEDMVLSPQRLVTYPGRHNIGVLRYSLYLPCFKVHSLSCEYGCGLCDNVTLQDFGDNYTDCMFLCIWPGLSLDLAGYAYNA